MENTIECEAYVEKQDLIAFKSDNDVLSNMHLCKLAYENTFFKSAEHAYQHVKCNFFDKHETAEQIMSTPSARIAKSIAEDATHDLAKLELWKTHNVDIMMKVLECKAESYPAFKNAILNSGNSHPAEATLDEFWGAGMTPIEIKNTVKGLTKMYLEN